MKTIVIPDIHTHYEKAERIMQKYKSTHKFILLGDYFDQFNDNIHDNAATAEWLKESLKDSNRIHLIGNHDMHYFPYINVFCSGYSGEKKKSINSVLTLEDWDKLKFYHHEKNFYFSHAGLSKQWFMSPMSDKFDDNHIDNVLKSALEDLKLDKISNAIWAADMFRGGKERKGGILWNDWRNMDLTYGIKQIVGHTPIERITQITDNITDSAIINVDCSAITYMSEVLEISEGGSLNILDTSYV